MIVSQTIKRARLSRLSTLRSRRHPAINPSVSKTWQFGLVNRKCLTSGSTPLPTVPPISTANLVDLQTSAKIEGEETQIAIIKLQPGQTIRAESGSLIYMTPSIQMETTSNVSDAMKRLLTGQALFVTDFTANHSQGELALGTAFPSKLIRLNLTEYGSLLCQKGAYVASNPTTMIELAFTKSFMSGFFGSEGFVLQKLTGEGDVLVQASGTLVRRDLKEGETLRVSTGSLVCMTSSVDYDIQMMPGFKNVMFGGEGLFVTTLCGPGTVWLQGMPPDRMISEVARRVPAGGIGLGVPIGAATSTTGSESDLANTENEVASSDLGEVAAATDDAIEADRLGTVASSGFSTIENDVSIDSDSPSALFGDVAPDHSDNFTEDQSFTNTENTSGDIWEDSEGKYTGDSFSNSDFGDEFEDDTTFTTFDGSMDEGTQETSKSFLSTIFDMFTSGDFTGGD